MAKKRLTKLARSKKGSEAAETTEVNIGQLLISIVQILIFVAIIVGLYSLTKKANADQGTQESFYQLVAKLQALDRGQLADGIGHAYFIKDGFYLYGFNKDSNEIAYKDGNKAGKVLKPRAGEKCQVGEACICMCNNKDCSKMVDCNTRLRGEGTEKIRFDEIAYFYVNGDPKNTLNKGSAYSSGGITGNYLAISGKDWRQGKVIYLARKGISIEVSFDAPTRSS